MPTHSHTVRNDFILAQGVITHKVRKEIEKVKTQRLHLFPISPEGIERDSLRIFSRRWRRRWHDDIVVIFATAFTF